LPHLAYKDRVAPEYADLVYNGQWFVPLKDGSDAVFDTTQELITGDVRLKRYKAPASRSDAARRIASIARTMLPLAQATATIRRMPRGAATSSACRSRLAR